ncbi:outer membrane beta-barrel protein [Tunturiibacter gelidoferens]|uniref:Opacity protein-like surface antigen n=1 Tax=Tunturiibacter lichenicola TaxID=2051959 RepID=A0A7Y9NK16_9BACT|nr:outer membrane beta-barrel protein [Edaphobacter lichenicola]NYF50749.1 opacity protein-like surface antigen [Edaphobacter lichenicola]
MKFKLTLTRVVLSTLLFLTLSLAPDAFAQSSPAATQQLQLSAFVGGTGTFTNLAGGKNLDITAGADITLLSFRLFRPAAEIRGSYPIDEGTISSQKNFLVGPRVEYPLGRLHPYANFLVGRGAIDYLRGGYIFGNVRYINSNTLVLSPGVGLDYNLTHHLAVKVDFQYQHWDTPAVPSGSIRPKAITLGAVYIFDFNPRHRHSQ